MENYQTCPCCNQDPRYKEILTTLLEFIHSEGKSVLDEMYLQQAVSNAQFDELDETLKTGGFNKIVNDFANTMFDSIDLHKRVIEGNGKMKAYNSILDFIQNKI
jgi:hypothetical protein